MVLHSLSKQLALDGANGLADYAQGEQRWVHAEQIRTDDLDARATHVIAGSQCARALRGAIA